MPQIGAEYCEKPWLRFGETTRAQVAMFHLREGRDGLDEFGIEAKGEGFKMLCQDTFCA
jgi:hypothetical protein